MTQQTGIILVVAGVVVVILGLIYHLVNGVQLIPHLSPILIVIGLALAVVGVVALVRARSAQL